MHIKENINRIYFNNPFSLWKIIDLIYPPFCCSCSQIGHEVCPKCFTSIVTTSSHSICKVCGNTLLAPGSHCTICNRIVPQFDQARAWGIYDGVLKDIVQKIKYTRGFGLIEYIIPSIIEFINKWGISFSIVAPIPLGKIRNKERGYNQAGILAKQIARKFSSKYDHTSLYRAKETRSQVGLNYPERKNNVRDAFALRNSVFDQQSVLLIDDITTTFATLNEASRIIKSAGALQVFCFTIARAKNPIIRKES